MTRKKTRDTYVYRLKKGKSTVYIGTSKNPKQRTSKHKSSGKKFSHVTTSYPSSKRTALTNERKAIKNYKKNHGRRPRYNKKG